MNQKDISSMISKKWKSLSLAEQQEYEQMAIDLKHLHQTQFPDYKFCSKRRSTSTKKTRYFSEHLQQFQTAIHQRISSGIRKVMRKPRCEHRRPLLPGDHDRCTEPFVVLPYARYWMA